jgi:hypothetical protein
MNAYGRIITPCIPNSALSSYEHCIAVERAPRVGESERWFGRGGKKILLFRE